jgi:hypothetical protein
MDARGWSGGGAGCWGWRGPRCGAGGGGQCDAGECRPGRLSDVQSLSLHFPLTDCALFVHLRMFTESCSRSLPFAAL